MTKASCNYKKKVKEEIKEKLDRSASNERRRCPSSTWYSHKTGIETWGKQNFQLPKKKDFQI